MEILPPDTTMLDASTDGATNTLTTVTRSARLLAGLRSAVIDAALTTFVTKPDSPGRTFTEKASAAPAASVPAVQMTLPLLKTQPGEAEMNVAPAGSASV